MSGANYDHHLLRIWRKESGLRPGEAAIAAGVGRMTLWRAENGRDIELETLGRIASFYGHSLAELMRGDGRRLFAGTVSAT